MITIREVIRSILIASAVIAAILAFMYMPGDLVTAEEKRQSEAIDRISARVKDMTESRVAEEVGAALAYAQICDLNSNAHNALTMKDIKPADIEDGGRLRAAYVRGVERVGGLAATDGGKDENRDLTCKLGVAAFGGNGSIIPALISDP